MLVHGFKNNNKTGYKQFRKTFVPGLKKNLKTGTKTGDAVCTRFFKKIQNGYNQLAKKGLYRNATA